MALTAHALTVVNFDGSSAHKNDAVYVWSLRAPWHPLSQQDGGCGSRHPQEMCDDSRPNGHTWPL